jgi:hypothetical protein
MLSRVLLAHLNELVSSVNLSYQYFLKEQGLQSLNLEYIIESLYELTTNYKEIKKINDFTKNIKKIKDNLPKENTEEDLKYFYMKSMTYSQFFMSMAICERIMNEKEVLENECLTNYLLSIKSFLKDFSKVVIKN